MALTASQVKQISCPEGRSQIKKFDANGLFILVKNNQSKLWRFKYQYGGKEQSMALGKYPTISLSKARELAEEARIQLAQGFNPMEERKNRKGAGKNNVAAFKEIALQWWERSRDGWSADYAAKVKRWLEVDIEPIACNPINEIAQVDIVNLMLKIEESGHPKKASPILSVLSRVFTYASVLGMTTSNPAQGINLGEFLKPLPPVKHHAAITDSDTLALLIKDIDECGRGSFCTAQALKLIPRIFLRPGEVRKLKWEYIDFDDCLIRIPGPEMKASRDHVVPLASQVVDFLKGHRKFTGYSSYVFPGERDSSKPISKNVVTNLLRNLGYKGDVMSAHGFRSTASTILHEQGWKPEVVEFQLAHLIGTETTRSYNRSLYLDERRKMMQHWADYLDELATKI